MWGVWWLSEQMLHFHSFITFFSVENFWLRKKRQIKRQIIKKRQIKKIKKSHQKQQISRLFIYRIDQFQLNTIYHYTNQKIDCIDSVRRMMTIRANTPFIIHSDDKNYVEKWKNKKLIRWKTTNILIIHLQNQMIPIKYNQ